MSDKPDLPAKLKELQVQLISKKLDALCADFPIKALRVLAEDGTAWQVGEFELDKPKKKRTRKRYEEPYGALTNKLRPWVELAGGSPGEVVKLRPSDIPEFAFSRLQGAASAIGVETYGKGNFSAVYARDALEERVLLLVRRQKQDELQQQSSFNVNNGITRPH